MTLRGLIIGNDSSGVEGWVEVDPFDFKYTGPDPDGEIKSYLNHIADGTIEYGWPADGGDYSKEYPSDLKLINIKETLEWFDEVWYVDLPDDLEPSR
jgi:hypothetical protein